MVHSQKTLTLAPWIEIGVVTKFNTFYAIFPGCLLKKFGLVGVKSGLDKGFDFTWSHTWSGQVRDPLYIRLLGSIQSLSNLIFPHSQSTSFFRGSAGIDIDLNVGDIRHQHLLFWYRRQICRTEKRHSDIESVPISTSEFVPISDIEEKTDSTPLPLEW